MTSLNDIFFVSQHELRTSTPEQIAAAEEELRTTFPDGYASVVQRFGAGEFCGELWMVLAQDVPLSRTDFAGELASSPSFWNDDHAGLSSERFSELITIAGTADGDLIAFLPDEPQSLYFLPRQATRVWCINAPFANVFDWYFGGGDYGFNVPFVWFEPQVGRRRMAFHRRLSPQENTVMTMSRTHEALSQLSPARVCDDNWQLGFDAFFPQIGVCLRCQPTSVSFTCDDTVTREQTAFIEEWIRQQGYDLPSQINR